MTLETSVGVWNVEWASARSKRGPRVRETLTSLGAEVLVVTEGFEEVMPASGHVVISRADYGYRMTPGRRKVLLWSRRPWFDVDEIGSSRMPAGRFVGASTETSIGAVCVLGVCIPWRDAHVRTGRRDRIAWQDHLAYLEGLADVLARRAAQRLIVAGDFNQRVPRHGQPHRVFEGLDSSLGPELRIATAGTVAGIDEQLIDHLAHGPSFEVREVRAWSRFDQDGTALSDHHGVLVHLVNDRQETGNQPGQTCAAGIK